ncbi:unnamed protein product [Parnassius mnemosyne]|uniref:Thioredoxin domain-containing protein n=1 Tax=Parnassius mnemosyne TaxID=213953 RepID=A0AAV1LIY7_9NEOP
MLKLFFVKTSPKVKSVAVRTGLITEFWLTPRVSLVLDNYSRILRTHKMSIHIKDSEDLKNKLAEAGDKLVVIDFMATWCGPCKMIGPKLDEMANEMADSIVVLKVDVDECEDIATEYNINSMPTFVFVKSSKKLEEFSGANVDKLKNTILKHK